MKLRWLARTTALVGVLTLVAAACGDGGAPAPEATGQQPRRGGTVTVAAEQWPECLNPITSCSSATWYWYSVAEHVLPYAMVLDLQGNFIASPTLVEAPTLDNGGITQDPFTVTYRINPEAVWEDGSPITSQDFDFTWRAIMNTKGAYTTVGYDQIDSIDTTDEKTAVIKFQDVFVDWPDLFGGVYQGIFKAAAFPQFADDPEPNLAKEMQDDIPFSGGPWVLDSWSKDQAVFSRNPNCFARCPNLDGFTIVPRLDQTTEVNSLLAGEVDAIYPQPSDASIFELVAANPNVKATGTNGAYFEALWINHEAEPMNDPAVREAFMYAIDREAIIENVIKLNNPEAEVLQCGFVSFPHIGPWCGTPYFTLEEFPYDPERSKQILEGAGWDCSSTPCTKGGQKLEILYSTVAGNTRRETTQQLLQPKALEAGFAFKIKNYDAGILFGDIGPKGEFTVADYATGGSVDPSITASFHCDNIPSAENEFAGGNWNRWCNQEASDLMEQSDKELDQQARLDLLNQVYALQEQDFLSVPLYILPNIAAWRADKLGGPVTKYVESNLGMYYNLNEWFLLQGGQGA